LPEVIARLVERIEAEAPPEQGPILMTAAYVLMGLRIHHERADELFQGVRKMRDSTTYQAILNEGRAEGEIKGRAKEAQRLLLRLGRKRLGDPDATVEAAVRTIADVERLELLIDRIDEVANWQDLFQTP
jgi:predicted transposase YdaD